MSEAFDAAVEIRGALQPMGEEIERLTAVTSDIGRALSGMEPRKPVGYEYAFADNLNHANVLGKNGWRAVEYVKPQAGNDPYFLMERGIWTDERPEQPE